MPIGVVTMALGAWLIKENRGAGLAEGIDVTGSVLVTAALMLGVYSIVTAADFGWESVHTLAFAASSVVLLALFVFYESRIGNPILPLRVLTIRSLTVASVARAFVFTGISTSFFIGVLYLQHIRGFDAFTTGLAFLPTTAILGVLSAGITARLMARVGPRNLMVVGMATIIAALSLFALADDHAAYFPWLLTAYALLGLGGGMTFLPLLTVSMSEIAPHEAGLASGFSNATMQVGGALGLAAVGTVSTNHATALIAQGVALRSALVDGYQLAFVLAAISVAVALAVVLTTLRSGAAAQPRGAAETSRTEEIEAA